MSAASGAPPLAVIFGCAGTALTEEEAAFFKDADPLGFILFARNCEAPDQVRRLVSDLRETVGRADAPVLIDQEGGRVARLGPPYWPARPPMRRFGELAASDRKAAREAARIDALLIAADLVALGIDVDCLPLLDVPAPGGHDIIGDRAFGTAPDLVAELGRAVSEGLIEGGVLPVIKHIPGHGRASADSHVSLPVVDAPLETLRETDFAPFRALADMPWAMTAHVVYTALDPDRAASVSPKVIGDVVRGEIGFAGLLLSDDICMKALAGTPGERAAAVLAAGCDVALHCNGVLAEMEAVSAAAPRLTDASIARLAAGSALHQMRIAHDREVLERRFAALMAA